MSMGSTQGAGRETGIVFFIFYIQNMDVNRILTDVKILIDQIFASVKILLFGGVYVTD